MGDGGTYFLIASVVLFIALIVHWARSNHSTKINIRARDVNGVVVVGDRNRVEQTREAAEAGESRSRRAAFWIQWVLGVLAAVLGILGLLLKSGS